MIGTLISILFALVIAGVMWWAVQQLLALVPLAEPFSTLVRIFMVLVLVLIVLWVIAALLGMVGIPVHVLSVR